MENETITDVLQLGGGTARGTGSIAARLLQSGFDPASLRTNDLLRRDEWIQYDQAIIEVARERLIGVADLLNAGLRYDIPNGLGTTRLEWERMGDMDAANINMSGVTEGDRDRVVFDLEFMPLPIIHKDFSLNIRVLEASRTTGQPLDVTQAAIAARKVADKTEDLLFNGSYIIGTQGSIYGYRTAPDRNTGSVTADWAAATGANIITDVLAMIDLMITDNMFGPYTIYVPYDAHTNMSNDFKTESDKTIMQRVLEVPGIAAVRPSAFIPSGEVIMVMLVRDVVDMVVGMQPTPLEWSEMGGLVTKFKVMSIMVPRMKSTYSGQSGIVHLS